MISFYNQSREAIFLRGLKDILTIVWKRFTSQSKYEMGIKIYRNKSLVPNKPKQHFWKYEF